ncbi:hypothetical protein CH333_01825 [candidate division WOR-3 bacterium JGI_Cruoil_03_44_89]|mgnify:CR=1 FL=1|uniref:Uncharacterized protein n=1 Tax=candidate division WOR-3 bacterium JGI_Cruoil_03_44_89 TaxID=1973748 RepID=A0A235BXQ4_UNCW3|nr:MAG: hypothetical protein CH333_01825 [candidate division WOR-3 bacterium JGI_Cruoil_03_44_89]
MGFAVLYMLVLISGFPSRTVNNLGFSLSMGYPLGVSVRANYYPLPHLVLEGGVGTSFFFTSTEVGIGYIPLAKKDMSTMFKLNLNRFESTGILEEFFSDIANLYIGCLGVFLFGGEFEVEDIEFGRIPPIYSLDLDAGIDYVSPGGFRTSLTFGPCLFTRDTRFSKTVWDFSFNLGIGYVF